MGPHLYHKNHHHQTHLCRRRHRLQVVPSCLCRRNEGSTKSSQKKSTSECKKNRHHCHLREETCRGYGTWTHEFACCPLKNCHYSNFIEANADKLVVVKFFAGFCRACRALEPKLLEVKEDTQLEGLPITWAEFESKPDNKQLFRDLSVMTLPTIHFYDGKAGRLNLESGKILFWSS